MTKLILLNSEYVLLDYCKGFGEIYKNIFKKNLNILNPQAIDINSYYDLSWENESQKNYFYQQFNNFGGDNLPEIQGADNAVSILKKKGYKIIALSSIPLELQEIKHHNLINKSILVDATIACGTAESSCSRENFIDVLKPNYYVDALALNFKSSNVKNILISQTDIQDKKYIFKTFKTLENFALKL